MTTYLALSVATALGYGGNLTVRTNIGSGTAWAPPSASVGTKLWYRADLGLTQVAGFVTALVDQSGLADPTRDQAAAGAFRPGYVASDAAYGNKPLLTFDGTQRMLSGVFAAINAPATVVLIGQINVDSGVFSDGAASNMMFKSGGNAYWYGSPQGSQPFKVANVTVPCCIMYTDDGTGGASAAKIYVQDTTFGAGLGLTNWAAMTSLDLGQDVAGVGKLNGKIAELIVFGGVLTPADLLNLVPYLNGRYGLGVT